MGLRVYKSKRNFSETVEPAGWKQVGRGRRQPAFVVQKHAARRLHYDFRLEVDGVLKSWAVPKGIPTAQGDKRLAMQVEDHPLEYGGFEGVIPAGNYGGGSVILWDRGTYEPQDGRAATAIEGGKLSLVLHGKKLNGHWSLIRMRHSNDGKENAWLLIKTGETSPAITSRKDNTSVKSGRTLSQIGKSVKHFLRPRHV